MNIEREYTAIVADQMPMVSEGICALCEGISGCTVLGHSSSGDEAWALIEGHCPDIALLDLHLPRMMTMELLRRTRQLGLHTRIIVLAVRADRKTVLESLRAGASGFVLKVGAGRQLEDAFRHVIEGGVYVSPLIELDRVIAQARAEIDDPLVGLSVREQQVFSMLVEGVRAKEIAIRLSLSPKTIDTYRASLMRKLDIHDVPGLVKFAIHHKITELRA